MNIDNIMSRDVKSLSSSANLNQAAQIMWEADCGALPIMDDNNKLTGMLTDRDILMAAYTQGAKLADISVDSAMAKVTFTCKANDDIQQALDTMQSKQIRRLPVVDDEERLIGILSLNDAGIAFKNKLGVKADQVASALASICEHRQAEEPREPGSETIESAVEAGAEPNAEVA